MANGKTIMRMGKVNIRMLMEVFTMGNGKTVIRMGKA